jgi:hypothetical protein
LARLVLEPVREQPQRVGKLVALDECSLGIKAAVQTEAFDDASERSKLFGRRRPG